MFKIENDYVEKNAPNMVHKNFNMYCFYLSLSILKLSLLRLVIKNLHFAKSHLRGKPSL